ncbi:MAG TPA: 2-dehydropantoate 2-reductase [Myxococcales bacterium]|nr:2-dehydropantoate 2-reductase [Myxococcales bacterium]
MRIGVIGVGAIGGVLAARLLRSRRADETIVLAAGSERAADTIRRAGLRIRGESPVPAPELVGANLAPSAAPYDLMLLCTRTDTSDAALASAIPLLSSDGALVCVQNGLPEERAAVRAGSRRTLGAVIGWSASSEAYGEYVITGGGKFIVGAVDGSMDKVMSVKPVLERAFPVRTTSNLRGARWTKLAFNCALSTLGAISGLDFGGLAARADARRLAIRIVGEAIAVAERRGVKLERVVGLDPRWFVPGAKPALVQHVLIWLAARRRPRQRSGMLQRLLAGRPAGQVDDLNGAVVKAAGEVGLKAPLNAQLRHLVHAIERGEEKIGPHQLERLERT